MISKNQIKHIISLQQKKIRNEEKSFIAEGEKVIRELLNSVFDLDQIYCIDQTFKDVNQNQVANISASDLKKISALHTPNNCLAVFKMPEESKIEQTGLIMALDEIRDPGNLGTIIRLCDWFGISQIICSTATVDVFNPKVVQASMGSLTRVQLHYTNLKTFIAASDLPVYGTFMDGENIYQTKLPLNGIIIMGNEANGISEDLKKLITNRIAIPRFGSIQKTESLNVATATAIILSEFKRESTHLK